MFCSYGTYGMWAAYLAGGEVIYSDKYSYGPKPIPPAKSLPYAFPNWIGLSENHTAWRNLSKLRS